jgi:hypothetical protein
MLYEGQTTALATIAGVDVSKMSVVKSDPNGAYTVHAIDPHTLVFARKPADAHERTALKALVVEPEEGFVEAPSPANRRLAATARLHPLRRSLARVLAWIRSYSWLWLVVALGALASWPGWYRDALVQSIMTNVFATFLVAPILVFGVDQVVRRAEERRDRPREIAAREELADEVAGVVSSLAGLGTIDTMLPGFVEKVVAGLPTPTRVSDDNARFLTTTLVEQLRARRADVERRVASLGYEELVKLMRAAAEQEIRARLFEAGPAIPPDAYAQSIRLTRSLRRIGRDAELAQYLIDKAHSVTSEPSQALRESFARAYLETIFEAAELYAMLMANKK